MSIRPATASDQPGVSAIYDEQVRTAIATFDVEPPHGDVWLAKIAATERGDRFLVTVEDGGEDGGEDGEVLGFAYSSSYRPRPGYRHTRETSVYLADHARGRGLGRQLYDDLLTGLLLDGVHTAVAVVALPNPASQALHRTCGFAPVGVLRGVGRKFDRWIDTEWWQRDLS